MKKKRKGIWIFILLAVVSGILIYHFSERQTNIKYYDIPLEKEQNSIAKSHSITPVSHTKQNKQDRFYLTVQDSHVDDGIFYEAENKGIEKGFLLEVKDEEAISQVYY